MRCGTNPIQKSCENWFNGHKTHLISEIQNFEETDTTSDPNSRRAILEAVARACAGEIDGVINILRCKIQQHKVPSSSPVYFAAHLAILAICSIVPSICWENIEHIPAHNLTRHDGGCAGVTQHVSSVTIIRPWLGLVFGLGSLLQWLVVITYCFQHDLSSFEMNLNDFTDNNFIKKIEAIYDYIDALGIQKNTLKGSAPTSASSYADLFILMKNLELCRHAVGAQLRMLDLDQGRVLVFGSYTLTNKLYDKLKCHILGEGEINHCNINIDLTHLREQHLKMLAKMIVEGTNLEFMQFTYSKVNPNHTQKLKKLICEITDLMRKSYIDLVKAMATVPYRHSPNHEPKLYQEAMTMDVLQLLSTYSCLTLLFVSVISYSIEAWTERHIGGSYQLGACSRGDLTSGNGWCCKFPLNKDGVNLFAWIVYPILAAACFLFILTIHIHDYDMIFTREFFELDPGFFHHAYFRMKALIARIADRTDISVNHATLPMFMILKDLVDNIYSVMVPSVESPRSGDSIYRELDVKYEYILKSIGILRRGRSHCCASKSSRSLDRISEGNRMRQLLDILQTIGFRLSETPDGPQVPLLTQSPSCDGPQVPLLTQSPYQGGRQSESSARFFPMNASPAGEGGRGSNPRAQDELLLKKFASVRLS